MVFTVSCVKSSGDPCMNKGTCEADGNSKCKCPEGFVGDRCETGMSAYAKLIKHIHYE